MLTIFVKINILHLFSWIFLILIFLIILIFYCYSITVACLFSPSLHPTPAEPPSLPHLHPPPWFCPCVLYSSSCNPLSSLSPSHSPLTIVRLFLTSSNLSAHQQMSGSKKYGIFTQWNSTQQRERRSLYPLQQQSIMELESIMLSEINQTLRDKYHMISPLTGT